METTAAQTADTTPNAGGEAAQAAAAPGKTFTQAELDAIIADRLQRERAKYSDYDALKADKEKREQASKSELEKLADRATKAEAKAREDAERYLARTLDAEARAVAATLGFSKPDKAIKLADLSKVVKDGEINADELQKAISALATEMPELLAKTTARMGATNPPKGSETDSKETDEQRRSRLRGGDSNFLKTGNLVMYGNH